MPTERHVTRVALVDVPTGLAIALQAALARIGARVVVEADSEGSIGLISRTRPGLLIVGSNCDPEQLRARCRRLRATITAPLVVLVPDGCDGCALDDEPSVQATLVTAVGIEAMVCQLPVVLDRWAAWRKPRLAGPLRVDRGAEPALEMFGMVVKLPRPAADALAAYADRRRVERRSGPLPRIARITGSLPRVEPVSAPAEPVARPRLG